MILEILTVDGRIMRIAGRRSIEQAKRQFAESLKGPLKDVFQELGYPFPEKCEIRVSLKNVKGRKSKKIRRDAAASKWDPETGRIEIRFKPISMVTGTEIERPSEAPSRRLGSRTPLAGLHPAEVDLLRALDRAESRPGWSFVALKKFRDEILLQEHFPSMRSEVEQQNVLSSVIEKRFVLLGKVPNLKSPQFPVTTIRLNRLMPEVRAALGDNDAVDLDFQPVDIAGEPLSTTILRERR